MTIADEDFGSHRRRGDGRRGPAHAKTSPRWPDGGTGPFPAQGAFEAGPPRAGDPRFGRQVLASADEIIFTALGSMQSFDCRGLHRFRHPLRTDRLVKIQKYTSVRCQQPRQCLLHFSGRWSVRISRLRTGERHQKPPRGRYSGGFTGEVVEIVVCGVVV